MNKTNEIFNIAKRDSWVVEYDSDLDTLYWSKPTISANTITKQFFEDFSLYVADKGLIEGLFIEYAKYNFVSHNKEYELLFEQLVQVDQSKYIIPEKNKKNVEPLLRSMANMVVNETFGAILKGTDLGSFVSA